ncbi:DoxX family protein [Saccharophagus degradans]|uniref:DoxX family protein n=1 Tax=Saccharophagus degradans TaxID=86304 RepID=A0AAW7XAU4_9GAMM|nr:DoxX family protein [Saccharophagus degradans]MBU2987471.1 DoxX family protein [Saccharophagus degradans]MDO6424036.1 DoxX family protein [Saccharophagus degradans]MDO6609405.1 DoxX family protein [Saccharophagus degradans]
MKNIVISVDRFAKKLADIIPAWATNLTLRAGIFFVFWNSVQTKLGGGSYFGQKLEFWRVTESTKMLFEYEYALPIIPAEIAAYMATFGEFFLGLGILFGFFTRFSAFGLLIMTLVIQVFVYPGSWSVHLLWAGALIYLLKDGGGLVSIDRLLHR